MNERNNTNNRVAIIGRALALSLALTGMGFTWAGAAGATADPKIKICHRTASQSNPYSTFSVSRDGVDGDLSNDHGQGDHYAEHTGPLGPVQSGGWGDIIPPVPGVHGGLNWTSAGQAIYNNNCNLPAPATTTSTTTTSTTTTSTTTTAKPTTTTSTTTTTECPPETTTTTVKPTTTTTAAPTTTTSTTTTAKPTTTTTAAPTTTTSTTTTTAALVSIPSTTVPTSVLGIAELKTSTTAGVATTVTPDEVESEELAVTGQSSILLLAVGFFLMAVGGLVLRLSLPRSA